MKVHPENINGHMVLVTEKGDVISNMTAIAITSEIKSKGVTNFTASFVMIPDHKKDN